jgi:hypothetical protein
MRDLRNVMLRLDPEVLAREGLGLSILLTGILFWLFLPAVG